MGSLVEAEPIPTEVAELAVVWHRLPDGVRAGIVAMVRASRRSGRVGAERSGTARRFDRQLSFMAAADLDLVAGHSLPGENASPGLSCGFQPFRCPGKSIANRFLDGNESFSYGGSQERGWALFQDVVRGENQ